MTIFKDFYQVKSLERTDDNLYKAEITLNPAHEIFRGHFPDNPVTPGVCMMQIAKELCERICEKPLFLSSASNVKFMAIINPEKNPELVLELNIERSDEDVKLKNTTLFGETIALKMNINYKILA